MWPDDRDLPVEVEAAFGADILNDAPDWWRWTSLTDRLLDAPISLRAGASSAGGEVSPGTCTVTLLNSDAALTPLHPMSPWWPNVDMGVPVRVRLRRAEDAFGRATANGWGTADSGQTWTVTGAGPDSNISVSAGVGRQAHTTTSVFRRTTLPVSLRDCEQIVDVATSAALTGAPMSVGCTFRSNPGSTEYYWLHADFQHGSTDVALTISKRFGGGLTGIATLSAVPGISYAPNTYLRLRAQVVGSFLAVKVWPASSSEPKGWQLTATDQSITGPGAAEVQSRLLPGNSNTLPVTAQFKNYALRVDRFAGFADQWEPDYHPVSPGVSESVVRVTASGPLRRITQGAQANLSAMRRTTEATQPVVYWPLEDGALTESAGATTTTTAPMVVTGNVAFKTPPGFTLWSTAAEVPYGTAALADLAAGGMLHASLPVEASAATAAGAYIIGVTYHLTSVGALSGDLVVAEWTTTGGTHTRWRLVVTTTSREQVIAYDAAGTPTLVVDKSSVLLGMSAKLVCLVQTGGTIAAEMWDGSLPAPSETGSVAGTLGQVLSVACNPTRITAGGELPFGHVVVWNRATPPPEMVGSTDPWGQYMAGPKQAHFREDATLRLVRVAAEAGFTVDVEAVADPTPTRMGPQHVSTLSGLFAESVNADMGVLREQGFGFGYLPREARYNQPVALSVDLATYRRSRSTPPTGVLQATYDDQELRNHWTVERTDGSFAVAADPESARRGVYSDSIELNVQSDEQLPDQAWWRVHLHSTPDLREASFPLDLAANPQYVDGWLSCGVGSRIVRTNPPSQHRPGDLDRVVAGWVEQIGRRSWLAQIVPSPARPWDVATVDGPQRVAGDGSTLAADLSSSATLLLLSSTVEGGPWTTDAADMPLDVLVGGEQVVASGIFPAVTDVFGRSVSSGWGTANSGQAWTTTGGLASDYSVNGSTGRHAHNSVGSLHHSFVTSGGSGDFTTVFDVTVPVVPTGAAITVWAVVRGVDASNYYTVQLGIATTGAVSLTWLKRVGGSLSSLASGVTVGTHTAGATWRVRAAVHGTSLAAKAWLATVTEPDWQTTATDSAITSGVLVGVLSRLETGNSNALPVTLSVDNFAVVNPQSVTLSARGVNGVSRAWPAGTDVDVWRPAVAAL